MNQRTSTYLIVALWSRSLFPVSMYFSAVLSANLWLLASSKNYPELSSSTLFPELPLFLLSRSLIMFPLLLEKMHFVPTLLLGHLIG